MTAAPTLLDLFSGEGGAAVGYHRAGFRVFGVDNSKARLARYPFPSAHADAIDYLLAHGHEYDVIHASPTCTGTPLVLDRHRLFECSLPLWQPEHFPHDRTLQVAGSYGGARRDKAEARQIRRGGYVPSPHVQRELLGVPWTSEKGCQLALPPVYTHYIGEHIKGQL